jgi:glycopeptide antibiotics resistance protein
MLNRRPILSAFAVLYIGAVFLLSLVREGSERASFIGEIAIFVPVGVIFVFLLGKGRWFGAFFLSGMVCVWLELGRNAWFANRDPSNTELGANLIGMMIGVAVTSVILAIVHRRRRQINKESSVFLGKMNEG